MKTTVTIEADVSDQLLKAAQAAGVDVSKLANDLVREALRTKRRVTKVEPKPFKQTTHKLGWHPGMTWEKIQAMLLKEEAEQYRVADRSQ